MCNVREDINDFEWCIVKEMRACKCLFEYVMKMNNFAEDATQRAKLAASRVRVEAPANYFRLQTPATMAASFSAWMYEGKWPEKRSGSGRHRNTAYMHRGGTRCVRGE